MFLVNNTFFNQPLEQFELFALNGLIYKYWFNVFVNDTLIVLLISNFHILSNLFIYLIYLFIIVFIIFNSIIVNKIELFEYSFIRYLLEIFFYIFIFNVFLAQVGKRGREYFPYLCVLFIFILFSNFVGLIPFSFTVTSHIILTFLLGGFSIVGLTILGFWNQKLEFLNLFIPTGVPKVLLPLLVVIEVISYIARGFSLSIRLFANLMSGHALMHILMFFIVKIINYSYQFGLVSLALISCIILLEFGISFLQAYVFIVLISIYFKDSYEVGH
uniref:ATP synthase subunit a n=1 Tax=Paramoeba aparasomata TaxID=2583407 RepID=A0A5P8HBA7_9EUKA|nr:ATPase subunit 6 [Paramoeba aparasomata]